MLSENDESDLMKINKICILDEVMKIGNNFYQANFYVQNK